MFGPFRPRHAAETLFLLAALIVVFVLPGSAIAQDSGSGGENPPPVQANPNGANQNGANPDGSFTTTNPDGSTTTRKSNPDNTTTITEISKSDNGTKTIVSVQNLDGTCSTISVQEVFTSGRTNTTIYNPDGSTVETTTITEDGVTTSNLTTTDKDKNQTVTKITVDTNKNEKTSKSTSYDNTPQRNVKSQTESTTDQDGNTTTSTAEGGILWDAPTTTTTTDKDGKITSTTVTNKDGTGSGSTSKGKYRITSKDGGIFVEWEAPNFDFPNVPNGSGNGIWYPPGTKIKPNIAGDGPFPYTAVPPEEKEARRREERIGKVGRKIIRRRYGDAAGRSSYIVR